LKFSCVMLLRVVRCVLNPLGTKVYFILCGSTNFFKIENRCKVYVKNFDPPEDGLL
jgi:hypothetical protein